MENNLNNTHLTEKCGMKISITEEVVTRALENYFPYLYQSISFIKIPDQVLQLDKAVFESIISLNNISIQILEFSNNNISIKLMNPNTIQLMIEKATGSINLELNLLDMKIMKIIPGGDSKSNLVVYIENLTILIFCELGRQKTINSKEVLNTNIFFAEVNMDFDFQIEGNPILSFMNNCKNIVRKFLKEKIELEIKNTVLNEINISLNNLMKQFLIYIPIENTDLAIDFTFTENPIIKDGKLILPINGSLISFSNYETIGFLASEKTNLIDELYGGKGLQIIVSEKLIKTLINTLLVTNRLQCRINSNEINSPISLNTSRLNFLLYGLEEKYGKDKNLNFQIVAKHDFPFVNITSEILKISLNLNITLEVEGNQEIVLSFDSYLNFIGNFEIKDSKIDFSLKKNITLSNSVLVTNNLERVNIESVLKLFNFFSPVLVNIINSQLKANTLMIPVIGGIILKDCQSQLCDGMICIQVNPEFTKI